MAVLMTPPFMQFDDDNGSPLAGGKIYTYAAGTTTPKATYTDASGNIAAQNPIILDSAGRSVVWVLGSYKFTITDANDNVIRTVDNVQSFNVTENSNNSYFESFSGNGTQKTFTLSQDLGADEASIFVFIDNGLPSYILNGGFVADTDWTKGVGWAIGSGVATASGAISTDLSQTADIALVQGQNYVVTYTITQTAGSIQASVGGNVGSGRDANGTYTETITAGATQIIAFIAAGFTGTIDNVSVKPVMSIGNQLLPPTAYTLISGQITFAAAPKSGTNNILIFAPSLLVGAASASAASAEGFADAANVSAADAAASAASVAVSEGLAESWAIGPIGSRPEGSAKYWAEQASEATIPNNSITTGKIADNAVTIDKLANGAVAVNKLAGGTAGELITWAANGAPAVVDPGVDGQVLTANDSAPPTFQDPQSGAAPTVQVFIANSTWTKPAGLKGVEVIVTGGGGGVKSSSPIGGTGGTSSFGAHCSATGGAGVVTNVGAGGIGTGGNINMAGGAGIKTNGAAKGGGSFWGEAELTDAVARNFGTGGGAAATSASGGGGTSLKIINATSLGATETVTVGAAGTPSSTAVGAGIVIVKEFY
jgi:hypothetical protein